MEPRGDNKSSACSGTSPVTNIGERELHPLTEQGDRCMSNDSSNTNPSCKTSTNDMLGLHSTVTPSADESSPGNPLHEPTNSDNKTTAGACETVPTNIESHDSIQVTKQGHHDMASSNVGTSNDSNWDSMTNQGLEIRNPPVQVMERAGESGTSSEYVFPSHVFSRNNTSGPVEWSTASNESLFSIYMGNTSFSNDLTCFKSGELDKPGDVYMSDQPNASPNHQPPAQVNKFNDISQRTAELHEESLKENAAKAAETMREVIMESCRTAERDNKGSHSRRQCGSANSYAFQPPNEGDKSMSSNGSGEKQNQQKQSGERETEKAIDGPPKSTTDAPANNWLGCFSCCT